MLKGDTLGSTASPAEIYERYFVPAIFGQWADRAVKKSAILLGDSVLDAGCGTGCAARAALSQVGELGKVSGLDKDPGMLEVAARKEPDIDWRHGDLIDMPFSDGCFDVVLCQFALMQVQRRVAALKELNRVLAPGGRLVISVWAPLESSNAYVQFAELVEANGGEKALRALKAPFLLGNRTSVNGLMMAGGFPDYEWEYCQGTARYPSINSFIDIETTASGAIAHFSRDGFKRLQERAQRVFQPWVKSNGELIIPLNAVSITAKKKSF